MTVRVAFHQTPALRRKTGIGHYTASLRDALFARDDVALGPLPSGWTANLYQWLFPRLMPNRAATNPGSQKRAGWRSIALRGYEAGQRLMSWSVQRRLTRDRFDVYHESDLPVLPSPLPTVLTIYDLSLILMPHHHPADRVARFERQLPTALERTSHIVTISNAVREEIIRVLGWPGDRVTTTYLGVRPNLRPLPTSLVEPTLRHLGLPDSYLLYVGTLEPRKNVLRLMQAYCRLPGPLRQKCPLLLVGGWGWNTGPIADFLHEHARHRGVVHLGYLPDDDLAAVYNGARALVYPSLYEGFGLPPLEMMACGGPVLASTAAALKEVFGSHAQLIDPDDDDGWTEALAKIIADDDWRARLCDGVRVHAGRFTWSRCAAETTAVYNRLRTPPVRAAA